MRMMSSPSDDLQNASLGELFKRLSSDMTLLVRQELDLFRHEMTEKTKETGKRAGQGAAMLSGAAVIILLGLGALTAAMILALALVLPAWSGALIVAILWAVAAAVMAMRGKQGLQRATAPVPTQTIETLKEDVEWAKSQTSART